MQISIKTVKGKSINLEVEDSSETIDIKIHGEQIRQIVLGPGQDEAIQVFVSTLEGKTVTLKLKRSETIAQVKAKIHENGLGHGVKAQILMYQGIELENNRTVAEYNIRNESNLFLKSNLCGC